MAQAGTAYVHVVGDLSALHKQLAATFAPSRLKKQGLVAGGAIAAGFAAAAAGKGLFELGENFHQAFAQIRVETGATGDALKGLEEDFKDVLKTTPASFGDTATAIAGLSARLNLTGEPLQELAKNVLRLSRLTKTDVGENVAAVTRLFGDWGIATSSQSDRLNELFRVSQRTGIGVGDLARFMVQFGSPLRQLGFDFDTAAVMFGKFEKEGVNLQTIMPGFRFALKNLSKPTGEAAAALKDLGIQGKEPRVALQEVFKAIKRAPTDLKANAIAFAIFGKRAGPDMAAAVREGRFEYQDLIKDVTSGGDTLEKAGEDVQSFSSAWERLKHRLAVEIEPAATAVFDTISKGMIALADADFGKISANISAALDLGDGGGLDTSGIEKSLRSSFASIRSIIESDFVQFVSRVFGKGLVGTLKKQVAAVGQIFKGFADVIEGTFELIDDLVHLRIGKAFGDLGQIFKGGFEQSLGVLRLISAPVREIGAQIGRALLEPIEAAFASIGATISGAFAGIGAAVSSAFGTVRDAIVGASRAILAAVGAIWPAIRTAIIVALAPLAVFVAGIMRAVKAEFAVFRTIAGVVRDGLRGLSNAVQAALRPLARLVGTALGAIPDAARAAFRPVVGIVRGALAPLGDLARTIFRDFVRGFRTVAGPVRDAARTVASAVFAPFRAIGGALRRILTSAMEHAFAALRDAAGTAAALGTRVGRSIVGAIRTALGAVGSVIRRAFAGAAGLVPNIGRSIADWLNAHTPFGDKVKLGLVSFTIPKLAKGGLIRDQRLALVGEQGPEIVSLPTGSRVYPHGASKRMAARMGIPGFQAGGVVGAPRDEAGAFEDVLRTLVSVASRYGSRIAEALVGGFVRSPSLEELSGGAWLPERGRELLVSFDSLGTAAGTSFGAAVGPAAAGAIGAIPAPKLEGAPEIPTPTAPTPTTPGDRGEVPRARDLKTTLDQVAVSRRGIVAAASQESVQSVRNLDLARRQREEVRRILELNRERVAGGGALGGMTTELREVGRITPGLVRNISDSLTDLPRQTRPKFAQVISGGAAELRRQDAVKGSLRTLRNNVAGGVDDVGRVSVRGPSRLRDRLETSFESMVGAVAEPSARMAVVVRNFLQAFGASGIDKINSAISSSREARKTRAARGGFLRGTGLEDTIPIMAAPGEAVLNRHQQRPVEDALYSTYGYGLKELFRRQRRPHYAARGGFAGEAPSFARGGFTRMVTGDTDVLRSMLAALEKMAHATGRAIFIESGRRTVSEQAGLYQKYAGIRPVARPSPNAPHVRGIAADIRPGREVFGSVAGKYGLGFTVPAESWHIQILHPGEAIGGARGGAGEFAPPPKLGAVAVTGDNVAGDLARGATRKVRRAAQSFVDRQAAVPTGGGGPPTANMSLGRRMMKAIFPDSQWPALRELWQRESGWSTTADNPSSDAYGIPQALPGSKMASAGRDWQSNPATQIKWGLQYIKNRYGSPSAALAFHDSHNWYQRGGFVDEIIREGGGAPQAKAAKKKSTKPKDLKRPPRFGFGGRTGALKWDVLARKWSKRKRARPFVLKQIDDLHTTIEHTIPGIQEEIAAIEDAYDLASPEFYPDERVVDRLRREGHNVEGLVPPGSKEGAKPEAFIDWSAVGQSKDFLSRILGQSFRLIGQPFGFPKGIMEVVKDSFDPLRETLRRLIEGLTKRINSMRDQVRQNQRRISRDEKRIERLDAERDDLNEKMRTERNKKKPDRDKLRRWNKEKDANLDEKHDLENEIKRLRKDNRRLTGVSDPSGELSQIEKGELGEAQIKRTQATSAGEDLESDRIQFVGQSGVGGDFAQARSAIDKRFKDMSELSAERIREAVALAPVEPETAAETDANKALTEQKTFLASIADLLKQYGSNVARGPKLNLPSFAGGGVIEGPKGAPVVIEGHGGEVVFDPRTKKLTIVVEKGKDKAQPIVKNIDARSYFQQVPKDPHLYSRAVAHELEAAI